MARDLSPESLASARLLIVDDEPVNVRLLETSLRRWGFTNLTSTTDPREVPFLCEDIQPDLVLTDLHMPHMDGYQLLALLSEMTSQDSYLPVIVLTADITPEAKKRALELGAKDFLSKPFDLTEVELRIKNLLESSFLHLELKGHNENLEELLAERTEKLWDAVTRLERSERELRVS
ncbi:MAG: response regulator, partial [Actinomycetota bacterium]|nr:response regulator [Actinomycetota bacterium]